MSAGRRVFVGVDGGGTKTRAVVVGEDGAVLGRGTAGGSNQNSAGADTARAHLLNSVREALAEAPESCAVSGMALCMSGVDRPGDVALVRGWVTDGAPLPALEGGAEVGVYNDAVAALASGTGGRLGGIVCIAGTGTIAWGRREADGHTERAAGWGCLTDVGSGYWIGLSAVRAAFAAADGTGPATPLEEAVRRRAGVERTEDLIGWVYSDMAFDRVASMAVLVFEAAAAGDELSVTLLRQAADALAASVLAVAQRLGHQAGDAFDVVAAGSVCTNERMMALLGDRLRAAHPHCRLVKPAMCAAEGAALVALQAWRDRPRRQ